MVRPEYSSAKIDHLPVALYKALDAATGPFTNSTAKANPCVKLAGARIVGI